MTRARIYLDHAATTPMDPRVAEAMAPFLTERFGNPSSLHHWGKQARQALEAAHADVATCLGAQPEEIIFTNGGTEADNLAVLGLARALESRGKHLITSSIEHSAVLKPCQFLESQGWAVTYLPVNSDGIVSPAEVEAALRPDTVLVSLMHGNNEVGSLQPIEEIGTLLRARGVPFHTDAVQTVGKLPLDLRTLPVDYLSLSGHKIYGPKGIGALYRRMGAPQPQPLLFGGSQEGGLRAGTENLPALVGLAEALKLSQGWIQAGGPEQVRQLQRQFIEQVMARIPLAVLNGPQDVQRRVPGNVHFSFPPGEGESLVLQLDLRGIAVSSGSACNSTVIEPSRVVLALGKSEEIARATLRFSLGKDTTAAELDETVTVLEKIITKLRNRAPAAEVIQ